MYKRITFLLRVNEIMFFFFIKEIFIYVCEFSIFNNSLNILQGNNKAETVIKKVNQLHQMQLKNNYIMFNFKKRGN